MAWYHKEADDSYRLLGGLLITVVFIAGAFLADIFTDKQYITPEIMHAILGFLSGCVLMSGRSGNGNGHNGVVNSQPQPKPKRKPFRKAD